MLRRRQQERLIENSFYQSTLIEEFVSRRYTDELFDRIIVKNLIGGKIIMARKIQDPSILKPLLMDTAILVPKSTLPGLIDKPKNVVGTTLGGLIKLERISYGMPMPTGTYRFEVNADASKYKVTNLDTGFTSDETAPAATAVTTLIPGIAVKVESLTGVVNGDYADVDVFGDTTFIVPGTVLGRLKEGPNKGKFEVAIDPNIGKYDIVRISAGTLETDASKRTLATDGSNVLANNDTMTVAVYIYAQLNKEICQSVNMTDALEKKIEGIVWG